MNWQIQWHEADCMNRGVPISAGTGNCTLCGATVVFGYEFNWILADGIEDGLEELVYLQTYGKRCEICGEFRLTHTLDNEILTPTDRGMKREYEQIEICEECFDRGERY